MGWLIDQKKDKFRLYSTISDGYITEYLNMDELIRFIFYHKFHRLMEDMLKEMICFPHGWSDKKTGKIMGCEDGKLDEYFATLNDRKKMYIQFLNKLKEAGISIDLKDVDGVHVHN